jgi:SAM-dependent methyltransferase
MVRATGDGDGQEGGSGSARAARFSYRTRNAAGAYAAERFAGSRAATDRRDKRALERALSVLAAEGPVLDCPCGAGRITGMLHSRRLAPIGADISLQMLEQAAESYPDVPLIQADALALPFGDGAFSGVVSMRFLYHLGSRAERVSALGEMARVARRWAVVSVFDRLSLQAFRRRLKERLGGRGAMRHALSRRQLAAEAESAGWRVKRFIPTFRWVSQHVIMALEKA